MNYAIIIVIFVIMLTGLVMSTLQATNPPLEITIHLIIFTLQVHKTKSYFLSRSTWERGWSYNFLPANCALVADNDTKQFGTINSKLAALL